jgi:hypothetical protein
MAERSGTVAANEMLLIANNVNTAVLNFRKVIV